MKKLKQNILTPCLIAVLMLSACGGESDNESSPLIEQTLLVASDGFNTVLPDTQSYIDLSLLITTGTNDAEVIGVSLESFQGSGTCSPVNSNQENDDDSNISSDLGFTVIIAGSAICKYTYTVESIATAGQTEISDSATIIVVSSADENAVLPSISVAMAIDDVAIETDVKAELGDDFPTGYILSNDFSVLGDGFVEIDTASFTVSYTPTVEGVSRVVYTLEGFIEGVADTKLGTIDYAVSSTLNNAPTAENFAYHDDVAVNVSVNIDVARYIDASDEDELQLVDVDSYTATVALKDSDSPTNTVFTFKAPTDGKHYVSYMISDHRGGFASAIVEVSTFDPDQVAIWSDIEYGLLLFSAPQTKFEIETTGDDYQGFYNDTNYTPTLKIPTFNYTGAQTYCDSRGRLPTKNELKNMSEAETPQSKWSWPIGRSYISSEGLRVVSLVDGSTSAIGTDYYYVTCVDSGGLIIATETDSTVVANGSDNKKINVTFIRDASGPVVDQVLDVEVTTGNAIPSASIVTTDANGKASFTVTNTTAEVATISVCYTNSSSEIIRVSTAVTFIGDIDSASVESLAVTQGGAAPDGESKNSLRTVVIDDNNNPVPGALVDISFDKNTVALVEDSSTLLTDDDGVVVFNITNASSESEDVEVTASFDSLLNGFSSKTTTVYFNNMQVCGSVNDTDKENATTACIKMVSYNGYLYTASPSWAALNMLGYKKDDSEGGNADINDGKTYAGMKAPEDDGGRSYGVFNQIVIGEDADYAASVNGVDGQYDRWCQNLAEIRFHGVDDWHRATTNLLIHLQKKFDDMHEEFGWPAAWRYWSGNEANTSVDLSYSRVFYYDSMDAWRYVSCVSAL